MHFILTTNPDTLIYTASVIYNILFARNKLVFEDNNSNEEDTLELICRNVHDFKICNTITHETDTMVHNHSTAQNRQHQNRKTTWRKPDNNVYKINTDANLSEEKTWGLGALYRDASREVVAAATWRMHGFYEPTVAEAYGIYLALEFAANCGFLDVTFESDCEQLIRILNDKEPIPNHYVGNVIREIHFRTMGLRHVSFSHVDRQGNVAAHKLAQHALLEPNKIWIEETPLCIVPEVLRDIFNH